MIDATITNSVTNAMHAICLLTYTILSRNFIANSSIHLIRYSIPILFGLVFILKMLGVYVHYVEFTESFPISWRIIGVLVLIMNFFNINTVMPEFFFCKNRYSLSVLIYFIISAVLLIIYQFKERDFIFIALSTSLIQLLVSYVSVGMVRIGSMLIVFSNIAWIFLDKTLFDKVSNELSYHNDLYHFMLIFSTFILFKGYKQYRYKP